MRRLVVQMPLQEHVTISVAHPLGFKLMTCRSISCTCYSARYTLIEKGPLHLRCICFGWSSWNHRRLCSVTDLPASMQSSDASISILVQFHIIILHQVWSPGLVEVFIDLTAPSGLKSTSLWSRYFPLFNMLAEIVDVCIFLHPLLVLDWFLADPISVLVREWWAKANGFLHESGVWIVKWLPVNAFF